MREPYKAASDKEKIHAEEGIDLSQLYERLAMSPTERLRKNFRMAIAIEALRKAGEVHRDRI